MRFVTAAALFDGHDAAINKVIHLGQSRRVDGVVPAALQEDAQDIAIISYPGGPVEYFQYAIDLLQARGDT